MSDTASDFVQTFTNGETRLWELLKHGASRDIAVLARAIDPNMPEGWPRYQQQRVASYISRMNRKLPPGWQIAPGGPRHTYQLTRS